MRIDPKTVRLLSDRVLIKRIRYKNPTLEVVGIKLNKGEVMAVGPGRRLKRLVRYRRGEGHISGDIYLPDGKETGKVRAVRVEVGDFVEYSRSSEKLVLDFEWEGEEYIIVPELSIYGVDKSKSSSLAILSQRSAGHGKSGFLAH